MKRQLEKALFSEFQSLYLKQKNPGINIPLKGLLEEDMRVADIPEPLQGYFRLILGFLNPAASREVMSAL